MKKMIVCNHKMFLNRSEALILKEQMEDMESMDTHLVICPSIINLDLFRNFELGVQDCFYEKSGPYTAEISCYSLKELGVKYSLVGHSYRRKYDNDKVINLKIKSLLENDITPILCVGETKRDYDLGLSMKVVENQIKEGLKDVHLSGKAQIIIAYEPGWLIGGTIRLANDKLNLIMDLIKKILQEIGINNYKLLYGGSVTYENLKNLVKCDIDGFLLGNLSVNATELKKIIDYTKKCKQ